MAMVAAAVAEATRDDRRMITTVNHDWDNNLTETDEIDENTRPSQYQ
jgi:hypothetical protein